MTTAQQLYEAVYKSDFGAFCYLHGPDRAQDLMLAAWERLNQFQGSTIGEYRKWLSMVIKTQTINLGRRDRRDAMGNSFPMPEQMDIPGRRTDDPAVIYALNEGVIRLYGSLNESQREIFALYVDSDMNAKQIGSVLGYRTKMVADFLESIGADISNPRRAKGRQGPQQGYYTVQTIMGGNDD